MTAYLFNSCSQKLKTAPLVNVYGQMCSFKWDIWLELEQAIVIKMLCPEHLHCDTVYGLFIVLPAVENKHPHQ